jgi:hypothetical protein
VKGGDLFLEAVAADDIVSLDMLVTEYSNVLEFVDNKGANALHKSVSSGSRGALEWLIARGVDIHKTTSNGGTAVGA